MVGQLKSEKPEANMNSNQDPRVKKNKYSTDKNKVIRFKKKEGKTENSNTN